MKKKSFLIIVIFTITVLIFINLFFLDRYPFTLVADFNGVWLEPSLNWSLALLSVGFILAFFNNNIFINWSKYFFIWYFPLAYLLTFTFPAYGGLMTMTRSGAAITLGLVMVVVTIIWILINFVREKKQQN